MRTPPENVQESHTEPGSARIGATLEALAKGTLVTQPNVDHDGTARPCTGYLLPLVAIITCIIGIIGVVVSSEGILDMSSELR